MSGAYLYKRLAHACRSATVVAGLRPNSQGALAGVLEQLAQQIDGIDLAREMRHRLHSFVSSMAPSTKPDCLELYGTIDDEHRPRLPLANCETNHPRALARSAPHGALIAPKTAWFRGKREYPGATGFRRPPGSTDVGAGDPGESRMLKEGPTWQRPMVEQSRRGSASEQPVRRDRAGCLQVVFSPGVRDCTAGYRYDHHLNAQRVSSPSR